MKEYLFLLLMTVFLFSCQKENVSDVKAFADVSEPVVEHVNISLTDDQLKELLSTTTSVLPETRSLYFDVEYKEDIDFWSAKGLAVILFGASWSGPTKIYLPIFKSYAKSCAYSKAYFGYCDVDDFEDLASKYGIKSVPTTVFIRYRDVVSTSFGILSTDTLKALTNQYKVDE